MDDFFNLVDESELEHNDPPRMVWIPAVAAEQLIWRDNEKKHDLEVIVASIRRYGFQEPAKFDANLPNVNQDPGEKPGGAIKSGNGRVEAVAWLERNWDEVRNDEEGIPRGLAVAKDGTWCIPLLVGTDAKSGSAARAYAIDANNISLAGGDFDGFDMARLWGPGYAAMLGDLDELPVSVDAGILEALSVEFDPDALWEGMPEFNQDDNGPFRSIIVHFDNIDNVIMFTELIGQVITDKTKWIWFPPKERLDLKQYTVQDGS